MSGANDPNRFATLTFEDFRDLAKDRSLSMYERIGFPDSYRAGFEPAIFRDVLTKLPALHRQGQTIVDIGPGSSELPALLIHQCKVRQHQLVLVDSNEMLAHLPDDAGYQKVPGLFPKCMPSLAPFVGRTDAILCYSVLQYAYVDTNLFDFVDHALSLLAPEGRCLLGDVPNITMRKRFFASETGVRQHQAYTCSDDRPEVRFNTMEQGHIDDAVVLGLVQRARSAGFHAYIIPQSLDLPMANRREDLLFVRP
jgi:hypothetical protein